MTRMLPQVVTAAAVGDGAPASGDERRLHASPGCGRSGCPDECSTSLPGRRSARGWRRAPSSSATAGRARPSTGRPASGPARRTCSSRSTPIDEEHLRAAPGRGARRGRRAAGASTLVHLQRAEALPGGRDHFGFFDGIAQPAVAGAGVRAAPGRRPARRRRRLARASRTGEVLLGYVDEDGTLPAAPAGAVRPQRHVRRLPQAAHGRRRPSGATSRRRRRYPGGPELLAAKIVGRWRDGTPLALSPDRPDAAIAGDPRRDQRLRLRRRPAAACAARSAPTSAAPTRATPTASSTAGCPTATGSSAAAAPYGPPLPDGVARGRRRRPRPGLRLLPGRHLAPVRDHPGALDRRRRPVRPRRRQGLPRRRAARHRRAR